MIIKEDACDRDVENRNILGNTYLMIVFCCVLPASNKARDDDDTIFTAILACKNAVRAHNDRC